MSSSRSSYNRGFELPEFRERENDYMVGGAMLPIFLNDLRRNSSDDLVEVTLELDDDDAIVVCNVGTPSSTQYHSCDEGSGGNGGFLARSLSGIYKKFPWIKSPASSDTDDAGPSPKMVPMSGQVIRRLDRNRSSAQRALKGLRFISTRGSEEILWGLVERRFEKLAKDGLISRDDFAECIGMVDSKEFAVGIFDALARRRRQKLCRITKEELYDFWLQISDQSFDARLQIFFDMVDRNEDGRITRNEVQELLILSASANKLSKVKERAEEYALLIMEELDPESLGYIEIWQLETLLLQRDTYMNYSRPLSTASVNLSWSQNLNIKMPRNIVRRASCKLKCLILENWQRGWIVLLWIMVMLALFVWKFMQYREKAAFQVMGYCLTTAKGAAETLKFNMALILLPVCRNTLTWLRSTKARLFVPFDDNINFHKMIACAIVIGVVLHAGNHILCDFPRLINSSQEKFKLLAEDFHGKRPTYRSIYMGVEGVTGIAMVILMTIAFTLATSKFRRNLVKLPAPFNRLTGFNAFWYSHHLFVLVYVLLLIHGTFLFLVHNWHQKTTLAYIAVPLLLYIGERGQTTCKSKDYTVKILKVSVLPGDVFSLVMSKPNGFKYTSGQYIFLKCPSISPFEWHPFSITSAPGDDHLSVHVRTVGDWTQELKCVFTEDCGSACVIGRAQFGQFGHIDSRGLPKLLVDGPYGAPAQDYKNYDVLLLVGLGIGATPFISILKDLLNNTRQEDHTDSNTDTNRSENSLYSSTSSNTTSGEKKKTQRTTNAHFYWVTREPGSFEWFKGVMSEVAEMDRKGQIDMHNYLTSVYEEGDARSTLITMVQALNHAKHGVDILSGTRVMTHFARPNWREVFNKIASKYKYATVGVFYCGTPMLAKELRKLSHELTHKTTTRFEFHKEYF